MKKIYTLVALLIAIFAGKAQTINFADPNFKAMLLYVNGINTNVKGADGNYIVLDSNSDGEIQLSEALNAYEIEVEYSTPTSQFMISSLAGIENFVNLKKLDCTGNQLTTLDVTMLPNLVSLHCDDNQLQSLHVAGLANLSSLWFDNNQVSSIDLSGLPNIHQFFCYNNLLSTLDLTLMPMVDDVEVSANQLTSLTIAGLQNVGQFYCSNNLLTNLDFTGCAHMYEVYCNDNLLTTLDLSGTDNNNLRCGGNPLQIINLKNGQNMQELQIENIPALQYICADDSETAFAENTISLYGYTAQVNSYCSFVPGGEYYTINGVNKFDGNDNGCDAADGAFPNLKYTITNDSSAATIISDTSGNFSLPVQAGMHTITPVIENPDYFNFSPSNIIVDFPSQTSPVSQNFCMTANGNHPDLEIVFLALSTARPGFPAHYKILLRNKGNQQQSGSISLQFNGSITHFSASDQSPDGQSANSVNWNFTNLLPFATRSINVTFSVNSPASTPPVSINDVLNYTAATASGNDDFPDDNSFVLHQTVVGSLDPNDKTCLEGSTITPDMAGKYVHYIIRFKNMGTAAAENIVVKDIIDTNKFDLSTLVPLSSGNTFTTRISDTNKVEFIFENINLPFDDANNEGYVAFKIKTKPTLSIGDTFSNAASIYFDYNFPVLTNTATTAISALAVKDFEFDNYFRLSPNPVNTVLNIKTTGNVEMSSISVYNALGQMVIAIANAQQVSAIDVSKLKPGNYFIKINSDKGTTNAKFVRN